MARIVIIQTAQPAFELCSKELAKTSFIEGTDFVLFDNPESAEEQIIPDQPQLLITGTFHGNDEAARSFVREMKLKNSKLTAAGFSALEVSGAGEPYDLFIKKFGIDEFIDNLSEAMKTFLAK